ncbi:hypothetical protein MAR_001472, partial [Mya arenaria]
MFALLLVRIDQLETKLSEHDRQIVERLFALEARREPSVREVYTFNDIPPTPTPSTPRMQPLKTNTVDCSIANNVQLVLERSTASSRYPGSYCFGKGNCPLSYILCKLEFGKRASLPALNQDEVYRAIRDELQILHGEYAMALHYLNKETNLVMIRCARDMCKKTELPLMLYECKTEEERLKVHQLIVASCSDSGKALGLLERQDSKSGILDYWRDSKSETLDYWRDSKMGSLDYWRDSKMGTLYYWRNSKMRTLDYWRDSKVGILGYWRDSKKVPLDYWRGSKVRTLDYWRDS